MRKARHLTAALIAAATLIAGLTIQAAPAGATTIQNQPWHGGRKKTDYYGGGGGCTSGPTFVQTTAPAHRFQAMPHHCLAKNGMCQAPFFSVYEGDFTNNRHDCWSVIQPPAGYSSYDVVLIDLGSATSSNNSKSIFDYCVAGNCSSAYGGGTGTNCNWCGSWWTVTSEGVPSSSGAKYKSGERGGQSGTGYDTSVLYNYTEGVNSYSMFGSRMIGATGCGLGEGDSGAPLFIDAGSHNAKVIGMVVAGMGTANVAGAGNSCYSAGTVYYTSMFVLGVDQIKTIFSTYNLRVNY